MTTTRFTKFSRSIILKSILILTGMLTLMVFAGTYYFMNRLTADLLERAFETSENQLQQMSTTVRNEMQQFGNQLNLIAKTSEIKSLDATIAASYLKSYIISPLFSTGERVSLFDRENNLICDNSMVGEPSTTYPIDFSKLTPRKPYVSPWYRDPGSIRPKRAFAAAVQDAAKGNGSLVASFSCQRIWKHLNDSKVGSTGFFIAITPDGEILYHPELDKWLTRTHKITELGFNDFNPRTHEITKPTFITVNDKEYLANYIYDINYDIGLIALQPKAEIDTQANSIKQISHIILFSAFIVILLLSFWQYRTIGTPLNKLIHHTIKITEGDMDIADIDVGKRRDEIGILSKQFNLMNHTIKRQFKELNAHQEMLEEEVRERTKELEEANRKLDLISRTDELTQLPNRRDMLRTINNEVERSARTQKPFCFIFIDIDHFKNVNDTYGHACGDEVLKLVSATIRSLLRRYDILARYGGEEFLALLPETELDGAAVVAERFRDQIEKKTVKFGDTTLKVTITLGVSIYDSRLGADRSIQLADKALYEGKESGRNKVVVWDPSRITEDDYKSAELERIQKGKI